MARRDPHGSASSALRWPARLAAGVVACSAACGESPPAGVGYSADALLEKARAICDRAEALGCPMPMCEEWYRDWLQEPYVADCSAEYAAEFDCQAEHMVCDESGLADRDVPACESAEENTRQCVPTCTATFDTSGVTCSGRCGGKGQAFNVACSEMGPDMECTCTEGNNTGMTFVVPARKCEDGSWMYDSQEACR